MVSKDAFGGFLLGVGATYTGYLTGMLDSANQEIISAVGPDVASLPGVGVAAVLMVFGGVIVLRYI